MEMFKIYGKPQCTFCDQAKAFLDTKGIEYTYTDIVSEGIDAAALAVIVGQPRVMSVPQIMMGETYIGGFQELVKKMK